MRAMRLTLQALAGPAGGDLNNHLIQLQHAQDISSLRKGMKSCVLRNRMTSFLCWKLISDAQHVVVSEHDGLEFY